MWAAVQPGKSDKHLALISAFFFATTVTLAQQYIISTIAGGGAPRTPAKGVELTLGWPSVLASDRQANIYFDSFYAVLKLDSAGMVTRVAGNSRAGFSGDGGPATDARLSGIGGLTVDAAGNLFIADTGNSRIRKVSPDGIIVTIAGNGSSGYAGDGGPAVSAQLSKPSSITVDRKGTVFVLDDTRVRRISTAGMITTVAGNGILGAGGDGGLAVESPLSNPNGLAVDAGGNLYIAGYYPGGIRVVSPDGRIDTLRTTVPLQPRSLAIDDGGNLYFTEYFEPAYCLSSCTGDPARVRRLTPNGNLTDVAGPQNGGFAGDNGPAALARFFDPLGVAIDPAGNVFVADSRNARIRRITPAGMISTIAGNGAECYCFGGDGGPAQDAGLYQPVDLTFDATGNLYIADQGNERVRKISTDGTISTVAGTGGTCNCGYGDGGSSGDGGPAIKAQLQHPTAVALDRGGSLYIADFYNFRIRKVGIDGIITTLASPRILPIDLAFDSGGNLIVVAGYSVSKLVNGGLIPIPGTAAAVNPGSIALDQDDNLFIADTRRVIKVTPAGVATVVAGGGTDLNSESIPATQAAMYPVGVAVDGSGNLFISEGFRIRKVSRDGRITTIAGGNGSCQCTQGDGGLALNASLNAGRLVVDRSGNIYFTESTPYWIPDSVIRVLRPLHESVQITSVADAASERLDRISPGKIVAVYGTGLGPGTLVQNSPSNGRIGTTLAGTRVFFNGIAAPILYTSAKQVAAIVPYGLTGTSAQVTVTFQGQTSPAFGVDVAASAPSLFTVNQSGAGQAAAVNAIDGSFNTAAKPVKIGGYISLYATGEGQTSPAGQDGQVTGTNWVNPVLRVSATVGGISAPVQYAGSAPGQVAGLMQVNVQIPPGVQPGGYVPVVIKVGDAGSGPGVWIAVAND